LQWERDWDGLVKMREWMLDNSLTDEEELEKIEKESKEHVRQKKNEAWERYLTPIKKQVTKSAELINDITNKLPVYSTELKKLLKELTSIREPMRRDVMRTINTVINVAEDNEALFWLKDYYKDLQKENESLYNTHLYDETEKSTLKVTEVKAQYERDTRLLNGYEILNRYFDQLFSNNPKLIAFGEDVGRIGDVNQGFAGLQAKYGKERIFDTGIRELTIMGQGTGMAMRGLRPIAEVQYLDYVIYGLQQLCDDVATLHYRTKGQQSCPLIVRTRGHRLEGIWHSGSPMGMLINSLRGMHICVPRNMVQAVGMYNTLLEGNDPAIVIECLNGYRLKEKLPANLGLFRVPLGVPEIVQGGEDITIVSYGSTLRVVLEAAQKLRGKNISCEVIDVQTLLPFDLKHIIIESLKKTNRIAFIDEDVPGGATAYMFNKVMEEQNGYRWLDVAPRTLTAKAHRPAYGSDGDYFSKPNTEDVVTLIREMMAE
jgi:pyruvate/2-oxoglutarate/acetoin dehydrogenase E1 component